MNKILRLAMLIAACSVAIYTPACGSDETQPTEPGTTDLTDVIYESGATDEALVALLSAKSIEDPAMGAALTAPAQGAELPPTPPTFTWGVGGAGALILPPVAPRRLKLAFELFGPERAAEAHGAPVNGNAYFLVFSTPKNSRLVRVFTTTLSYTPDAAAWSRMKAAGAPITASVLTGTFANNRLAEGGGPFAGSPTTFTIQSE
ncbi:MAG: hypothetical protein HUU21_03755 [Polyangiaceae bacterium]|nr:hypothetical protein [Polyangiaceae bacterium]